MESRSTISSKTRLDVHGWQSMHGADVEGCATTRIGESNQSLLERLGLIDSTHRRSTCCARVEPRSRNYLERAQEEPERARE